mgnify:CR=1 FL=1
MVSYLFFQLVSGTEAVAGGDLSQSVNISGRDEIADVGSIGGDGGVIVMGKDGAVAFSMNTSGMYRGSVSSSAAPRVAIYADEEPGR